jgi:hypothetical protein
MSDPQLICDLADIRFAFCSLPSDAFSIFFNAFLFQGGAASETCRVDVGGANPELCTLRAKGAWNFSQMDGRACLMGANPDGEVLWRMTGAPPFERLHFEWHPTAFEAMYRNEVYGMYGIVAILALVLRLLPLGGLVIHGSAQVVDGQGIICTGPSGRGKSTISRLFHGCCVPVLTDERPIVRPCEMRGKKGFRVYGSPWPSSGKFTLNAAAPLKKIYFIEHGPEQEIVPLTTREAVLRLLDVALVPWLDSAFFDPLIQTLESIIHTVPYAVLRFRPEASVVDVVRRDLASF